MKLDITSIIKNNGGTINIRIKEILEDLKTGLGTVSFINPVSFTGNVTNNNGMLILKGLAKVDYTTVCDRCVKEIKRELSVEINENIIEKEEAGDETDEILEDDRFTFSGNFLDLDRILADCILTSVPMSQVCREDCPGLCHMCGKEISTEGCNCNDNGTTDSRFEVLKGFFD
ncbi:MAG: YceD family protein [Acetivibrionales bacterium]